MTEGVEGYALASGQEGWYGGHELGIKVFVKLPRGLNEADNRAVWKSVEDIKIALMKETLRLDPETAKTAAQERAEILACFPMFCYVEEIPNGYCSQYCCAFKPWYIVTTPRGRIKIGWRKSVIHLEWTESAIAGTAETIFPKEEAWPGYETTAYDKVIHAHGYPAATGYIKRLLVGAD